MPTTHIVRFLRFVRIGLHVLRGMTLAGLVFPLMSRARRQHEIRRWFAQLLGILRVRLHVHGNHPSRGVSFMLAANHVSWLDIPVINAALPIRFVAKSEVRRWPVIGWLSTKAGTLFIERARHRDAARLNLLMAEAMRAGDAMAVFPESTTTDGSKVLRFHGSLLQSVLTAGAVLIPVAIRFSRVDGTLCTEAAYDGDKSLWDTLGLILTQRAIHAHVHFLAPLAGHGRHRRELARAARESILQTLFPSSHCSHTGKSAGPPAAMR
ncbi:MAG TPA: lysophospholipid acyltransferase family protein [Burkholderiales bacterium]|nr:lysophospholipid acyltransferase family protein [Burkholderiales bacterium]